MGLFKAAKNVAGRVVDVRVDKWISWDYLTETSGRFKSILLGAVISQKATYSETFEEAMMRLNLTETDIQQRIQEFTKLLYFFLALSVAIIGYGLYMAVSGGLVAAVISFCLSLYTLSQAFRFHFWLFQVKHRKLGCTLKEWMNSEVIHVPQNKELSSPVDLQKGNTKAKE